MRSVFFTFGCNQMVSFSQGQKMKKMAILLVWVLALAGCYINPNSKSSLSEADFMNDDLKVYGAYKTELVGPIEWEDNDVCNKAAFLLYARQQKNVNKLVDVIMKQTCTESAPGSMDVKCHCSYSGIAMNYVQIDAREAALWGSIADRNGSTPAEEPEQNTFAPSGPANEAMIP